MSSWTRACATDDIDLEDVIRVDVGKRTFAVYRSLEDTFHCTDGRCTHQPVHLSRGFVMGHLVECPGHNGQFDYTTGEVKRSPPCEKLQTYPVRVEDGEVFIDVGEES